MTTPPEDTTARAETESPEIAPLTLDPIEAEPDETAALQLSACVEPGPPGGYPEAERWILVPVLPDGRVVLVRYADAPISDEQFFAPAGPGTPAAAAAETASDAGTEANAEAPPTDQASAEPDAQSGATPAGQPETADRPDAEPDTAHAATIDDSRAERWALVGVDADDQLLEQVRGVLTSRFQLQVNGMPAPAAERFPARLAHPRNGEVGLGWLRAVRVPVTGEPQVDPLVAEIAGFDPAAVPDRLGSDLERLVFGSAVPTTE